MKTVCGHPLEVLWRDEDIAMMDPALRGITTCQRTPGHTEGYHSARTDEQRAEVNAYLNRARR